MGWSRGETPKEIERNQSQLKFGSHGVPWPNIILTDLNFRRDGQGERGYEGVPHWKSMGSSFGEMEQVKGKYRQNKAKSSGS